MNDKVVFIPYRKFARPYLIQLTPDGIELHYSSDGSKPKEPIIILGGGVERPEVRDEDGRGLRWMIPGE